MLAAELDLETDSFADFVREITWLEDDGDLKSLWGFTAKLVVYRGTSELVSIEDTDLLKLNWPTVGMINVQIPWSRLQLDAGNYVYHLLVANAQQQTTKILTGRLKVR